MGRGNKAKRDTRGPLQRMHDREQAESNKRVEVNEFAKQHGDYDTNLRYIVNRGGTPIARWKAANLLTESQQAAIAHCIRLWEIVSSSGKLVANLDRTVFGCPGDGHPREIEARDDLHRIKGYFPHPLDGYWSVFENVVRFDEPAGTAGSRYANDTRNSQTAARLIVGMVADTIAMKERLSY